MVVKQYMMNCVVLLLILTISSPVFSQQKNISVDTESPLLVWMYPLFGERITRSKFGPVQGELEQLLERPVSLSVSNDFSYVGQMAKAGELDILLGGNSSLVRKLIKDFGFVKSLSTDLSIVLYSRLPEKKIKSLGVAANTMADVLRAKEYAQYPYKTYDNFFPMYKAYLAGEIDAMLVGKVSFYLLPKKMQNKKHIRREVKGEGEGIILFSKDFAASPDAHKAQQYFLSHQTAAGYFFQHDMGVENWEIATEL